MSYTATARTVMKLGSHEKGNLEAHIYESGESYDVSPTAATTYTDALVAFPYTV